MEYSGFQLLEQRQLKEVWGTASLWEHKGTKAQCLSITNTDENKCFGVCFRTPPTNSTGVAHIMEHSVLCGSQKYPVKEPFVELLKGSLQTFLNAFTFPDKTCYPVASANLQDFYNLIDVYLDCVFHPMLSEDIFRQEGWHIEADDLHTPWVYKGVVFNEMKGAYSSPDSVLAEQSQQSIFPDMLYRFDSGGNPEEIPNLTYEAFRAFHDTYYHPSNARFFFWGDDPEEERFAILERTLANYTFKAVDSHIPLQQALKEPVYREIFYAAGNEQQKAMFTMNWLLAERGNVLEALQMEMLSHILEGMPGSPLQRALIESGLGEDTAGCGLETDLRQMYYSTGLKGIAAKDIPKAEALIHTTLQNLVKHGIPQSTIDAAVNTVEFDYRESNTGRFPRGLVAMINALATWLYDGNPIDALAWETPLRQIKERLAAKEPVFEELISKRLIDNPHRSTVVVKPDCSLGTQREQSEADKLAAIQAKADAETKQNLVETTRHLKEIQTTPDSKEALATIPQLTPDNLPRKNTPIPETCLDLGFPFYAHEQPTVGIAYTSLFLPLGHVPTHLLPLLPLYFRTLTEIGTEKRDYVALGDAICGQTGGIHCGMFLATTLTSKQCLSYCSLAGKAVYAKVDALFGLFEEILCHPLRDTQKILDRLGQILLEIRASLEESVQSAGHAFVQTRLRARYNLQDAIAEQTNGISYLESIRALVQRFEKNPSSLLDDLACIRSALLAQEGAFWSCTAEEEGLRRVADAAKKLLQTLPKQANAPLASPLALPTLPSHEAFITPARINFVGKGVNLAAKGWHYHGSASVIMRYLRMSYLWETVRVRGGAYGAFCTLDRAKGSLLCTSYRDPNVEDTLKAYDDMALFLKNFTPDTAQLNQAIVGAVGDLDTYHLPSAKGSLALSRTLTEDTESMRQTMREEMLSTTAKDFRDFSEIIALLAEGETCVIGGQEASLAAKRHNWTTTKIL
ncbi:MAG: insulinase family protein [Desulfovibrio sp.]|nr:insulinase family protein [Desulfovibrio sp.]